MLEELLDIEDVARITKLQTATIRKYVLMREIPFHKIIKAIRFKPSEIETWIANNGKTEEIRLKPVEGETLFDDKEAEGHGN